MAKRRKWEQQTQNVGNIAASVAVTFRVGEFCMVVCQQDTLRRLIAISIDTGEAVAEQVIDPKTPFAHVVEIADMLLQDAEESL